MARARGRSAREFREVDRRRRLRPVPRRHARLARTAPAALRQRGDRRAERRDERGALLLGDGGDGKVAVHLVSRRAQRRAGRRPAPHRSRVRLTGAVGIRLDASAARGAGGGVEPVHRARLRVDRALGLPAARADSASGSSRASSAAMSPPSTRGRSSARIWAMSRSFTAGCSCCCSSPWCASGSGGHGARRGRRRGLRADVLDGGLFRACSATAIVVAFALVDLWRASSMAERLRTVSLLGVMAVMTSLFLLPGAIAFFRNRSTVVRALTNPLDQLDRLGATLPSYLVPSPRHPFLGEHGQRPARRPGPRENPLLRPADARSRPPSESPVEQAGATDAFGS